MKVGILTFHWAANHGALLQAYALQMELPKIVKESEVVIIDYYPERYEKNLFKALCGKRLSVILNNLKEMRKEFILKPFRDKLNRTARYYTTAQMIETPPDCDIFIAGSDQVWNEYYTMSGEGKKTSAYFLPFKPTARHISYAASFGLTELKPEMQEFIYPLLAKFDAISVREATGKKLVEAMGLKAQIVCDPSVLLERSEYEKLASGKSSDIAEKYIAKYILRREDDTTKTIFRELKRDHKVVDIELLPFENWLGAIRDAKFLVTNSFHGMMVALKMHTDFAIILANGKLAGMNDRFYTILDKIGLADRIIVENRKLADILRNKINWNQVDLKLDEYAAESKSFIHENCLSAK